jgi:carboxylesterase type B
LFSRQTAPEIQKRFDAIIAKLERDARSELGKSVWKERPERAASAYMYLFKWETPVLGGRLHTPHGLEIPFAYDKIAKAPTLLGSGPDLQPLADKVSEAWTAFAHTGNPSQKGLRWPAYDIVYRPTMVFNDECKIVNDPGKEARLASFGWRSTQAAGCRSLNSL